MVKDPAIRKRGLLIVAVLSLALFITLMLQHDKLQPLDIAVNNALVMVGLQYFILFNIISFLGSIYLVPILLVIFCMLLWRQFKKKEALWLCSAAITNYLVVNIIKVLTNWSRPEEVQRFIPQTFPSAHASTPFVVYMLSYLFLVKKQKKWHVLGILLAVVLISLSRIVLNKHWLTDVLGGWLLAVGWMSGVLLFFKNK